MIKNLFAKFIAEKFGDILKKKGYLFFDGNKKYNLNIIGIRNDSHDSTKFDDTLLLIYRNKSLDWEVKSYEVTTEPGPAILRKPINQKGTAILVPGQYRGT